MLFRSLRVQRIRYGGEPTRRVFGKTGGQGMGLGKVLNEGMLHNMSRLRGSQLCLEWLWVALFEIKLTLRLLRHRADGVS